MNKKALAVGGLIAVITGATIAIVRASGKHEPPPPPENYANLYGLITDASTGKAISGALVELNGYSMVTGGDGYYEFLDLPYPGTYSYTLVCFKDGYEAVYLVDIILDEGNNPLDIPMASTGGGNGGAGIGAFVYEVQECSFPTWETNPLYAEVHSSFLITNQGAEAGSREVSWVMQTFKGDEPWTEYQRQVKTVTLDSGGTYLFEATPVHILRAGASGGIYMTGIRIRLEDDVPWPNQGLSEYCYGQV